MLDLALSLLTRVLAIEQAKRSVARGALAALAIFVAAVCVFAAFACACAALWIFVAHRLGPVAAPLIVAAALICVALIVLAAAGLMRRRPSSRLPSVAGMSPEAIASSLFALWREHKTVLLLGTALAGLLLGGSRSRRSRARRGRSER